MGMSQSRLAKGLKERQKSNQLNNSKKLMNAYNRRTVSQESVELQNKLNEQVEISEEGQPMKSDLPQSSHHNSFRHEDGEALEVGDYGERANIAVTDQQLEIDVKASSIRILDS